MEAMVYTRPGVVEVLDVDAPEVGAGEVLIDVEAAGICGSELHGIAKPGFRRPPLVMGHEFAGRTPDGRRVTVNPIVRCGDCDCCRADMPQLCRTRAVIGIHRAGAFAEQVAVPESSVRPLPEDLPWEQAALIEPLANAVHAWRLVQSPTAPRVGIIGAGTIGLVCVLAARGDAAEIMVTDLADNRLALAEQLGADTIASELDGEFDVIIDAVGAPVTHSASIIHLRPGGTTVWLGLMSTEAGFDSTELIRQEKRVVGSFAYRDKDFDDAVALSSMVDLSWSTSFPLSEGAGIFTELMNGRSDVVKAVLRPRG